MVATGADHRADHGQGAAYDPIWFGVLIVILLIADTVAVAVHEGARIHLIDDSALPPGAVHAALS